MTPKDQRVTDLRIAADATPFLNRKMVGLAPAGLSTSSTISTAPLHNAMRTEQADGREDFTGSGWSGYCQYRDTFAVAQRNGIS